MNLIARNNKITRHAMATAGVMSKLVIAVLLVAVVHNFMGIDVRFNPETPKLQVHLVVFENAPSLTYQRLLGYFGSFFKQPHSGQVCREKTTAESRKVG